MNENSYLTNMPDFLSEYGICKVLAVRREIIHIKHIFTELFVRKTIDLQQYLGYLDMSLFEYMEIMTNRIRNVHHFSRNYTNSCNDIVKYDRDRFFPVIELLKGLDVVVVLDFDGVVTSKSFNNLYNFCIERSRVEICSANPTISEEYFKKNNLPLPAKINAMKGKLKKIKKLIEIQKKHDYVFYVDNETEYLDFAWIFGLQTFHWINNKILYYSLKSK